MMKIVLLLGFVVIASALVLDPSEDPRCRKSERKITFEHESDESKYYQCVGRIKRKILTLILFIKY